MVNLVEVVFDIQRDWANSYHTEVKSRGIDREAGIRALINSLCKKRLVKMGRGSSRLAQQQ